MKTLFILRHAKSSWSDSSLADFERPLNSRGLKEATVIGNVIYENKIQPNLVLCSPAKRAKQTAVLVKEIGSIETEITYEEKIYEASPRILLQLLTEADNKNETIMLIGHNPGLEDLLKSLTGNDLGMPTAGFAKIDLFVANWNDVVSNCGQVDFLILPKEQIEIFKEEDPQI